MPRNIRIVLVEPSHPGNIGATARAMKTMCLDRLVLVNPRGYPDLDATARASGATDVLDRAQVVPDLDRAVSGCGLVVATSARRRGLGPPELAPREAVAKLLEAPADQDVAILFGRERIGLTNEEVDRCHFLICIPTNPEYGSLNLAAAVQVVSYELMLARLAEPASSSIPLLATAGEMELFYAHLEEVALDSGFLDPANPKHLMRRFRRLFNRTQPDKNEINILRGFLTALQGRKHRRTGNT